MAYNEKSLLNLNRSGRKRSTKLRFDDVINDERFEQVLEELYTLALDEKTTNAKIKAIEIIIDRKLGKLVNEVISTDGGSITVEDVISNGNTLGFRENKNPQDITEDEESTLPMIPNITNELQ